MTIALATGVGLLLLVSAVLSAAETAAFSLGASSLRTLLDEGFRGAEELRRLRARSGPVQATVHLLVNIVNLTAVGLGTALGASGQSGFQGAVVALVAAVALVLLVGEILPRALAARRPVRIALTAAPALERVERAVRPVLSPILRLELLIAGRNEDDEATAEEREAREVSAIGREEGVVGLEEHLLVERAFRLDELTAWEVMTPRVDIFAWPDHSQLRDIIDELASIPYSRIPVFGESIDDITGILYVREAYETFVSGGEDVPLSRVARVPFFVPASLSLTHLMRDFQARRLHMGIVADEFGGTDGLVTLEDVLEELVGEIVDETDLEDEPLTRVGEDELVAEGSVDLREINQAFGVDLPQLEHRSLNGFILEEFGYVPEDGESIERAGVRIDVMEATDTQVVRARLTRLASSDERATSH